ncbi:LacI family DNA-binding transcriptional regulator [Pseudolysinimonas sp.]|uniref:LacI family DNA-binding transcriptional regulator n=1 Tax=Pseudolysinimonas sp. TaxID=2680009 RepID=UPI003F8162AB
MSSPRKAVTLSDIAARVGTSVPTVSKVLRGRTDVSTAMRRRVLDAAHALGYLPQDRATSRSTPLAPLVDLVISNVEGTWANGVLSGVEEAATDAGVDVVLTIARPGREWVARLLRRPSEGAVIMLVDPAPAELAALTRAGIAVVLVDPMSPAPSHIPTVGVTNREGGRVAAEHLLALGHRDFGIVAGARRHRYSTARVEGFRTALDGAAARIVFGGWDRATARAEARALFAGPHRPTAVFACSDLMALGVYDAAAELGIHIPEDLSVVGFDDVPEAQWASPPLTTVRQPITDMGAAALRALLVARSERQRATAARLELPTSLVPRSSTRSPAGARR